METSWKRRLPALAALPAVLLALLLAAHPTGVHGQGDGAAATATALVKMQQSIYATQTAAAAPAPVTGTTVPATRATSTPIVRQTATTPATTPTPTATATPRATPVPPTPRTTPQPVAADSAPAVTVLVAGLNLRSGPGVGYAILGNAAQGQRLPVRGQWGGCAWLQVQLGDGRTAWTSGGSSYTRLNVPCSALAAVAAPALPATAAAAAPRPTTAPQSGAAINAPVLVAPADGAEHFYTRITFAWRWEGELQPGWGFDIRAWQGDGSHNSIVDARSTAGIRPDKDGIYRTEITIPVQYSQSAWRWTVAVVQLEPFTSLSNEAAPFSIRVDTSTPTPRPTETPVPDNGGGDDGGSDNGGGDDGGGDDSGGGRP